MKTEKFYDIPLPLMVFLRWRSPTKTEQKIPGNTAHIAKRQKRPRNIIIKERHYERKTYTKDANKRNMKGASTAKIEGANKVRVWTRRLQFTTRVTEQH